MSDSNDDTLKSMTGCVHLILWLFLVQPLWYALIFGILQRIESEPWMWICFWIYVPAGLVSGVIAQLFLRLK